MTWVFVTAYGFCMSDFCAVLKDGRQLGRGSVNVGEVPDYSYEY